MSGEKIRAVPITAEAFAPFGELIDMNIDMNAGDAPKIINNEFCKRFHDLAQVDTQDGQTGISLFHAKLRSFPYSLDLLERHPLGSQAFMPLDDKPFLVTVAADKNGTPTEPRAFITAPHQGINLRRNVWHGVLTPLSGNGVFIVIDYVGTQDNVVEHILPAPILII